MTFHRFCDRCDREVGVLGVVASEAIACSAEIETAACSLKYTLCARCSTALRRMSKARRWRATRRAIVRRAAFYSEDFGRIVAGWCGVRFVSRRMQALGTVRETSASA